MNRTNERSSLTVTHSLSLTVHCQCSSLSPFVAVRRRSFVRSSLLFGGLFSFVFVRFRSFVLVCCSFIHSFIAVHRCCCCSVPSFLRSFVPSFLRSFVPSFLRAFVPSFLRSPFRVTLTDLPLSSSLHVLFLRAVRESAWLTDTQNVERKLEAIHKLERGTDRRIEHLYPEEDKDEPQSAVSRVVQTESEQSTHENGATVVYWEGPKTSTCTARPVSWLAASRRAFVWTSSIWLVFVAVFFCS